MKDKDRDEMLAGLAADVDAIKRILVFQLLKDGVSQSGIAEVLGVSQATVSRVFPNGLKKALEK